MIYMVFLYITNHRFKLTILILEKMHPIVIIGSGMAGYTLAREFRKLNPEQELVMICADDAVNYAKPTLSNAFAGKSPRTDSIR